MSTRFRCVDCGTWVGDESELLTAANPFDPRETVFGCPVCKSIGELVNTCDEPGCARDASCGWPTSGGGYRRTCHEHRKQ